jgi:hypothetical protein
MSEMTAEQALEAQRAEYGRYVAKEDIYVGTALAFRAGDPVPVGHVESGAVDKAQVVGATTKAAAAVTTKEG